MVAGPQHPLSLQRRGLLLSAPLLALPHPPAHAATARPILDQPMRRLRLPKGTVGRDYVLLQLKVGNRGPFDFMVDTGLTAELITPHLRQALDIPPSRQVIGQGLGAGGALAQGAELVSLSGARLVGAEDLELPSLSAVVTDFLQQHMDPDHDPVEGMLGMELLENFDVDFDFPKQRIRFFRPGEGIGEAASAGLVDIPAAVLNETGILGIRVTSPEAAARGGQPFVGILDCGASFSAINWQAAALAGLPPQGSPVYGPPGKPPKNGVAILGVDGKPQVLPMTNVRLTFVGKPNKDARGGLSFDPPPSGWKPWKEVQVAVGDLPAFSQLLGDGRKPFNGPAALIGLDVLSQRRVVVGAGAGLRGRAREVLVSKA